VAGEAAATNSHECQGDTVQVYDLLGVGIVILLGILGGKISHKLKIPKVTGYMLTGLVFGPSVLGLISSQTLIDIHIINDVALGLILFAIGGEIELNRLKAMGRKLFMIAFAESLTAFALVTASAVVITGDWQLAVLLGCIGIATAPGVMLLVIREYRARGELTETLLAVVAINNVLCLILFRVFLVFFSLDAGGTFLDAAYTLLKELAFAVGIGAVIAALIAFWEQKIDDLSELLLVIIGGLLLGIGLARTIGISHLMVCLIIGAVTNNLSMMHRLVYAELRQTEMPFYIAFFVLSGASLQLDSLANLGLLGGAYLIVRPLGKAAGAYFVGKRCGAAKTVVSNLGMALVPQAGVAIGMVIAASEALPATGQMIGAVVLSSVIIYEGVGPFLTRLALARSGEIFLQE
jgi:Kef-type K+ transport system membrane component KefB